MTTAGTSKVNVAEPGYVQTDADAEALRLRIRTLLRTARTVRGLTQAELGRLVGASRFTVNRAEAGVSDVPPDLAEQLAQVLDLPELTALVAQRDGPLLPTANTRDAVVTRMLSAPGLRRVRVALADDLDLYKLVHIRSGGDSVLRSTDVEIVVPTIHRGQQLFGANSLLYGHIEYQIKRLLDLKKSEFYAANSLRLYESDDLIASVVVAATATATEAALWPPLTVRNKPNETASATLPVGVTVDPNVIAQLETHLDSLAWDQETIKSNEVLCRVSPPAGPGQPQPPSVFTRYFTVGEDQEEDIDDTEGTAVALVLVVALCPRKRYGVGRRVITDLRMHSRQDRRRSLFSNTVEDVDIQRARSAELGRQPDDLRSTRGALAATLDITDFLDRHSGVVPDLAFQFAAAREMAMFDLNIEPDRFQPIELPADLRLVRKPAPEGRSRAAIAPRLFVLELRTELQEPELAILQAKADVDEVGTLDLAEDTNVNDFLVEARESGFLAEVLASCRVVER
jgi:transcriptional regulator with XRE-family HTH domain